MKKAAFMLIFLLAGLVAVYGVVVYGLFTVQRLAGVVSVSGRVERIPRGQSGWQPVKRGELVQVGDQIRTGPGGTVELNWADGTRARLDPGSSFTILKCTLHQLDKRQDTRLKLDLGGAWFRLRRRLTGGSKFEVRTPNIVVAVRGTVFRVEVAENGATTVSVRHGQVAVQGAAAGQVAQGEEASFSPGAGLRTEPMPDQVRTMWADQQMDGPFLQVDEPAKDVTTPLSSLTVAGLAGEKSALTINGQPIRVDRRGRFRAQVPLKPGPNAVTVVALDEAGRTEIVRQVTYSAVNSKQ